MDNFEQTLATEKSTEEEFLDQVDHTEAPMNFIRFVEEMIEKSPKHACALLFAALGYKGDGFADKMQLTKRKRIMSAPM